MNELLQEKLQQDYYNDLEGELLNDFIDENDNALYSEFIELHKDEYEEFFRENGWHLKDDCDKEHNFIEAYEDDFREYAREQQNAFINNGGL